MKREFLITAAVGMTIALFQTPAAAQNSHKPILHVNTRWKECSIQLDPSLTQAAWQQFTKEAGLVAYFRPLADARPMGKGKFELSVLQWKTEIDDHDAAWNDTFVHPDSTHWLFEGSGLEFPGLTGRVGITDKTDVGVYFTKNPNANYGFYAVQVQQNVVGNATSDWAGSVRVSFASLFGPDDVNLNLIGADLVASRRVPLSSWATVSPYAGVSTYLASSHEKSAAVNLDDERVLGAQAMAGAVLQLSVARLAVEYNVSKVNSLSLKVGFAR